MLNMATELAHCDPVYEDVASKFFEHFVHITDAINTMCGTGLWDEEDGFYYDRLSLSDGGSIRMKIRSLVGLLPLIAVTVVDSDRAGSLPNFAKRFDWFMRNHPELAQHISQVEDPNAPGKPKRMFAIPSRQRLIRMLHYMLDENEFLSPYGIRSVSLYHREHPFNLNWDHDVLSVTYNAGDSRTGLFGGNSNWRGTDLVSDQPSDRRGTRALPPFLWRHAQGRVPPPAPAIG